MLMERTATSPSVNERVHPRAASPVVMKDGSTMSALDLATRFYESDIGSTMPDQPLRYVFNFGYAREDMRADVGHDLCPIGHQKELTHHLGNILDAEFDAETLFSSISQTDEGTLMLSALIHDIGEAMHDEIKQAGLTIVGDIAAGKKTDQDRANEAAVRQFLYARCFSDVADETIERVEAIIAHKDDTMLHELFEAAHQVQTLETSNYAYYALAQERWFKHGEVIDLSVEDNARMSGLLGISRVAFHRQISETESLTYFSHVKAVVETSKRLRNVDHRLLDSLYDAA